MDSASPKSDLSTDVYQLPSISPRSDAYDSQYDSRDEDQVPSSSHSNASSISEATKKESFKLRPDFEIVKDLDEGKSISPRSDASGKDSAFDEKEKFSSLSSRIIHKN